MVEVGVGEKVTDVVKEAVMVGEAVAVVVGEGVGVAVGEMVAEDKNKARLSVF